MSIFQQVVSTDGYLFAVTGPVIVGVWRQRASQAGVDALLVMGAEMRKRYAHFGVIGIAELHAPMPDGPVRRALGEALRALRPQLAASSFLLVGDGFRAATLRSVTTGLSLLFRESLPYHIDASTAGACAWLAQRLNPYLAVPLSPTVLAADVERLRQSQLNVAVQMTGGR